MGKDNIQLATSKTFDYLATSKLLVQQGKTMKERG